MLLLNQSNSYPGLNREIIKDAMMKLMDRIVGVMVVAMDRNLRDVSHHDSQRD